MTQSTSLNRASLLLRLVSYLLLGFVAIWFLAAVPFLDQPASLLIDFLDWPLDGGHDFLSRDVRWLSAIGAGLLSSMAMTNLLVVAPELERGNFRVLRGSAIATVSWYVIDSLGSWTSGVPSNVVFNTAFFVLLLYPVWLASRAQKG